MIKVISQLEAGDVVVRVPYSGSEKLPLLVHWSNPARAKGYYVLDVTDAAGVRRNVAVGHGSGVVEVSEQLRGSDYWTRRDQLEALRNKPAVTAPQPNKQLDLAQALKACTGATAVTVRDSIGGHGTVVELRVEAKDRRKAADKLRKEGYSFIGSTSERGFTRSSYGAPGKIVQLVSSYMEKR